MRFERFGSPLATSTTSPFSLPCLSIGPVRYTTVRNRKSLPSLASTAPSVSSLVVDAGTNTLSAFSAYSTWPVCISKNSIPKLECANSGRDITVWIRSRSAFDDWAAARGEVIVMAISRQKATRRAENAMRGFPFKSWPNVVWIGCDCTRSLRYSGWARSRGFSICYDGGLSHLIAAGEPAYETTSLSQLRRRCYGNDGVGTGGPRRERRCKESCPLSRPGDRDRRSTLRRILCWQCGHRATLHWLPLGRRPRLVWRWTLPAVERHPQQSNTALARGHGRSQRLPPAIEQQQRQHARPPGTARHLRTRFPPCNSHRIRWNDHRSG